LESKNEISLLNRIDEFINENQIEAFYGKNIYLVAVSNKWSWKFWI